MAFWNIVRGIGTGLPVLALAVGCNEPPVADDLVPEYGPGIVRYVLSGTDEDGIVLSAYARFNGGVFQSFENNAQVSIPIIPQTNSAELIVWDDDNAASKPKRVSFVSPSDTDVYREIDAILNARSSTYSFFKKNKQMNLGESGQGFIVDYLIRINSGIDAVVNWVGHGKNLEAELSNRAVLKEHGIPSLYIVRIPLETAQQQLTDFINRGYTNPDE